MIKKLSNFFAPILAKKIGNFRPIFMFSAQRMGTFSRCGGFLEGGGGANSEVIRYNWILLYYLEYFIFILLFGIIYTYVYKCAFPF